MKLLFFVFSYFLISVNNSYAQNKYTLDCSVTSPCMSSGISSYSNSIKQLHIFPNPIQNTFQIETPISEGILEITNTDGKLVYYQIINKKSLEIETSKLTSGMYLITVRNSSSNYSQKIEIIH